MSWFLPVGGILPKTGPLPMFFFAISAQILHLISNSYGIVEIQDGRRGAQPRSGSRTGSRRTFDRLFRGVGLRAQRHAAVSRPRDLRSADPDHGTRHAPHARSGRRHRRRHEAVGGWSTAPTTTPTGSSRSRGELPRNTTPSAEPDGRGGVLEESSPASCSSSRNPMPRRSPQRRNPATRSEARGYSAWDPASPAFIVGSTLCIPTVFIAYTGEALRTIDTPAAALAGSCRQGRDGSMPLLRPQRHEGFQLPGLGSRSTSSWTKFVGPHAPTLVLTGRTLMGHESAKNQQLEDHYFGAIPERVIEFMRDLEYESPGWAFPSKTRHNEVAPNQLELAPIYEEANLANDHNQLLMTIMNKIARRHNFRILLHEKPLQRGQRFGQTQQLVAWHRHGRQPARAGQDAFWRTSNSSPFWSTSWRPSTGTTACSKPRS